VLAPRELLKFFSSSLFTYCETTAGLATVGHATIFAYRLATVVDWTLSAQSRLRPQPATSRHKQQESAAFKSAYLVIDKTQQVGVNLHIRGFQLTVGLQ